MFISVCGLNIEYSDTGTGTPVLLLHGWGSSFDVYKGITAALCGRCRVVALNFPGCGNSETMKTPWTVDDYCNLVLEFMKQTKLYLSCFAMALFLTVRTERRKTSILNLLISTLPKTIFSKWLISLKLKA